MKTQLVIFLLLVSSMYVVNAQNEFLNNTKIGLGISYGGQFIRSAGEFSIGKSLNKTFTINIRSASNFSSLFRIGGGLEANIFRLGNFQPSLGIEIYHQSEKFVGAEEAFYFRNIQNFIALKYHITNSDIVEFAAVGNNTRNAISTGASYRISYYRGFNK